MAASGGSKQLPIRRVEWEMKKEEDLRGWTCEEGVSFFRFYRKERVAPRDRNGVQARIRRAHASRARGFSSHPTHPSCLTLALESREFLSLSNTHTHAHILSLFLSLLLLFCSGLTNASSPSRTCTNKLTDRHWIPSYTNTSLRKLYDE